MKANGSRREEREEKISRKKSGASPGRCREKNSVSVCAGGGGGGGRRSMRGAGAGRRRVREPAPGAARTGRHSPRARPHDNPPRAECPDPARSPSLTAAAAAAAGPGPRRATTLPRATPTLHVQSVKVSASDRQRESAPAPDLQAGSDLLTAQG